MPWKLEPTRQPDLLLPPPGFSTICGGRWLSSERSVIGVPCRDCGLYVKLYDPQCAHTGIPHAWPIKRDPGLHSTLSKQETHCLHIVKASWLHVLVFLPSSSWCLWPPPPPPAPHHQLPRKKRCCCRWPSLVNLCSPRPQRAVLACEVRGVWD